MAIPTKQALLQALSGAEGRYISGEQLAQTLGVSRAAIHKAAAAPHNAGVHAGSLPRRGYRLLGGDPFCADAVGEYPAPVYVHERLDSSNQTAKRLALAGAPHGTLVLAGQQSAGRGRMGRRFESPAGKGIYLSLVLRVPVPASKALGVTVGAAVAVARAVQKLCGIELGIKWVNDLYYQGKKGLRHPDGSRHQRGERPAGMAGGGHRAQPDHHPPPTGRKSWPVQRAVSSRAGQPLSAGRRWPGPLPGSCWPSARLSTAWTSTAPAALCRGTGSPSAPPPRPTRPGPSPLMTMVPSSWSGRVAAGPPCSTAR